MNALSSNSQRGGLLAAALLVSTLAAGATAAHSIPVAPVGFPNASASAPATTDIRDIRSPRPITSPWLIPLIAMTAFVAVSASYGAWAWNRRRFRQNNKRPLDIALERLAIAAGWMKPSLGREFSIEVSTAVRDYVECGFDVRAAHLTTDEFLHQLLEPAGALLTTHRSLLDNFLQTCDLAKFGGWNLTMADMEAMLQSARRFVEASAGEVRSRRVQLAATAATDHPHSSSSRETYVSFPST